LTAYLLGNFILQAEWIVKRARPILPLILRGAVVTLTSYLLLGAFQIARDFADARPGGRNQSVYAFGPI
jgi:hypothetical protein